MDLKSRQGSGGGPLRDEEAPLLPPESKPKGSPNNANAGSNNKGAEAPASAVALSIAMYATCSSLMLVVNKLAVFFLPAPAVVLLFQLFTTAGA
eukprot:scaffold391834_cov55-Prasinocladus_malaysianus.AAC.1